MVPLQHISQSCFAVATRRGEHIIGHHGRAPVCPFLPSCQCSTARLAIARITEQRSVIVRQLDRGFNHASAQGQYLFLAAEADLFVAAYDQYYVRTKRPKFPRQSTRALVGTGQIGGNRAAQCPGERRLACSKTSASGQSGHPHPQ